MAFDIFHPFSTFKSDDAYSGKLNGATTGVHLHFAITHNGEAIDPLKILNIR